MDRLQAAIEYCSNGLFVIPVKPGAKIPAIRWKERAERRPDEAEIKSWFKKWPDANIGILTGKYSGVDVLDFDSTDAEEYFRAVVGDPDETLHQRTGNGKHFFFRHNGGKFKNTAGLGGRPGIDVRTTGGIVIMAPSIHKSGREYAWGGNGSLLDGTDDLADWPADMLAWIETQSKVGAEFSEEIKDDKAEAEAIRRGFDIAGFLRRNDIRITKCIRLADHKNVPLKSCGLLFSIEKCLFHVEHLSGTSTPGEAGIGITAGGKLFYQCFHGSCNAKTWADVENVFGSTLEEHQSEAAKAQVKAKDIRTEAVEKMNRKYAIIKMGGQTLIMEDDPEQNVEAFLKPGDFNMWFKNRYIWIPKEDGSSTKKPIAEIWLGHENRRQYKNVVFAPGQEVGENTYNLWKGFAVDPVDGDWSLMEEHIFVNLCGGNREHFDFFLKWCSGVIRYCAGEFDRRPEIAIILHGTRGFGKDTFCNLFGQIFGRHYASVSQKEHLLGKFNEALKNCVFCHAAETFWAGDKAAEGVLKDLITNDYMFFEAKYRSAIRLRSSINLIISSNPENAWVIPAGAFERRFFLPTMSTKKPSYSFFTELRKQWASGGAEAMLFDLMNVIDVQQSDFFDLPKTDGLKQQVEISMTLEEKFWFECLNHNFELRWGGNVSSKTIYEMFCLFCQRIQHKGRLQNQKTFSGILSKYIGERSKTVKIDGLAERGFQLETIDIMRDRFDAVFGFEFDYE